MAIVLVSPQTAKTTWSLVSMASPEGPLQPGSIVSLHLGHAGTVAAFERLVSTARSKNLEPVVVSRLLQA